MSTVPATASHTRGTYFSWTDFALTNATVDIGTSRSHSTFIDFADQAQCSFVSQMSMADLAAQRLNEYVEEQVLATYASFTAFDNGIVTNDAADAVNITIDSNNVDEVVGAMKREIMQANGWERAIRDGMFVIWRALDFEKLEGWARQNGYGTADEIIINGIKVGIRYLGVDHYYSNLHTAGHVFGGVKRCLFVGILNETYGKAYLYNSPSDGSGNLSGTGIHERIDYGITVPTNYLPLLFDVKVN